MTSTAPAARLRHHVGNWFWLAAYLMMLVAVIVLVLRARDNAFSDLDTPEARAQWQAWRESEPNQNTSGPVRRRPPSATEPPELVLMRDHFPVVMSGSLVFSSLLFAAVMMAVRGAFSKSLQANAE